MTQKSPFDAAIVADMNDRVLFWSSAAETMFGLSASEAVGRSFSSLFEEWPQSAHAEARKEKWAWHGSELSLITIRERDHETEAKEREELQRQLEEARRISALGRVAATMAHEFNNVMMGINTFVEILKRRATPEAVTRAVRGITASIERGRTVTEEVLRYARTSNPSLALIDVSSWFAGFTPEAQALTNGAAEVRSERDLWIRGDASQLTQVIVNSLINARHASPPGAPITIEAKRFNHTSVAISVTDHGS